MTVSDEYLDNAEAALLQVAKQFEPKLLLESGQIDHEIKSDDTPVTALDLAIELDIRAALHKLASGTDQAIGIIGEEHGADGDPDNSWYIDPIDGTEQFIRGVPAYRIMATLVTNAEVTYTFVYNVARQELYTARAGKGAYCNGQKLQLSNRSLKRAWIEYCGNLEIPEVLAGIPKVKAQVRGIRVTGDFTHTPQGRFEGHLYYSPGGSTWDWTPWALLIKEAGGKVANLGSDSYDYKNGSFLAAPAQIFDELKPLVDEHYRSYKHEETRT